MKIIKKIARAVCTVAVIVLGILAILAILEVITLEQLTTSMMKIGLVLGVVSLMAAAIALLQSHE